MTQFLQVLSLYSILQFLRSNNNQRKIKICIQFVWKLFISVNKNVFGGYPIVSCLQELQYTTNCLPAVMLSRPDETIFLKKVSTNVTVKFVSLKIHKKFRLVSKLRNLSIYLPTSHLKILCGNSREFRIKCSFFFICKFVAFKLCIFFFNLLRKNKNKKLTLLRLKNSLQKSR